MKKPMNAGGAEAPSATDTPPGTPPVPPVTEQKAAIAAERPTRGGSYVRLPGGKLQLIEATAETPIAAAPAEEVKDV